MSWDIVTVCPPGVAGDVLHPAVPMPITDFPFVRESADGSDILVFEANGATVTAGGVKVMEMSNTLVKGYITASRFVVFCEQYSTDKGYARMRPGFIAIGHLRWPWLAAVGTSPPSGGLRRLPERLQLRTTDATDQAETERVRHLALTLFAPTVPADQLARSVYSQAISYRLAHEQRTGWERLLSTPDQQSVDKFSYLTVPRYIYARAAMPGPYAGVGTTGP